MALKKSFVSILIPVFICVFIICFAIGKAIAIKDSKEDNSEEVKTSLQKETVTSVSSESKKVEKNVTDNEDKNTDIVKIPVTPPERMLFPCGKEILQDYTQKAIYSKTMDDWRAHLGIDYKTKEGEAVLSVWDGTVQNIYKDILWGYTVEILHDGDILSKYKNLDKDIKVKKGEKVVGGQAIGKVGNSASVEKREDSHLHFELWTGGEPINPNSYVY